MREMEKAQDEFPLQFLIQMVNNNLMLNKTCYVICSDGANFLLWDVLPPLKLWENDPELSYSGVVWHPVGKYNHYGIM